jgi:hypothetical protein
MCVTFTLVISSLTLDFCALAFYLQAINQQTQEMQVGAENFASIAAELAKKMETRKWYEF